MPGERDTWREHRRRRAESITRIAAWAITGLLATIGLFFGLYSGVPWIDKGAGQRMQLDLDKLETADASAAGERRAIQLEIQRLRSEVNWLMQEVERVKAYVYPAQPPRATPTPPPPRRPYEPYFP